MTRGTCGTKPSSRPAITSTIGYGCLQSLRQHGKCRYQHKQQKQHDLHAMNAAPSVHALYPSSGASRDSRSQRIFLWRPPPFSPFLEGHGTDACVIGRRAPRWVRMHTSEDPELPPARTIDNSSLESHAPLLDATKSPRRRWRRFALGLATLAAILCVLLVVGALFGRRWLRGGSQRQPAAGLGIHSSSRPGRAGPRPSRPAGCSPRCTRRALTISSSRRAS